MKVNPPQNLLPEDRYLFPDLDYELEELGVVKVKDAYITKSGIVFKLSGVIKASIHRYSYLYFTFFKVALANFLLRKKKALPAAEQYLVIHNHWCRGYYHWIGEALPRLWKVKDKLSDYVLVLPKGYPGFQMETLKTFSFKGIVFQQEKEVLKVKKLVLPENPARLYEPDPAICCSIRDYYRSLVDEKSLVELAASERIYITRKNAKKRKIANENEIEAVLSKYGFSIVSFDKRSFMEQVAILYKAKCLVSIHGAGLTNMQFMPEGGAVLELHKKRVPKVDWGRGRRSDLPSPCYTRLSSALQHKHYIQFCEAVDPQVPMGDADLIVNPTELENTIRMMLGDAAL